MKISKRNLSAMILSKACLDLGLKEIPGPESHARITAMFARFGLSWAGDETAWCGVYLGDLMARMMEPPGGLTPKLFAMMRDNFEKMPEENGSSVHAYLDVALRIIENCFIHTGKIVIPEDPAWARSWLGFGQEVYTAKTADKPATGDLSKAVPGDVCIFSRGPGGHAALFVDATDARWILCLGGNQSNKVCHKRYHKGSLLGIRRAVITKPGGVNDG